MEDIKTYRDLLKAIINKVNDLDQEIGFSVNIKNDTENYFTEADSVNILGCGIYFVVDETKK